MPGKIRMKNKKKLQKQKSFQVTTKNEKVTKIKTEKPINSKIAKEQQKDAKGTEKRKENKPCNTIR